MYGSIYYNKKKSVIHWSEYDSNNKRIERNKKWVPDFFIKTNEETKYKSQNNQFLKQIVAKTFAQRRQKITNYKDCNLSIYGSDISPENKFILENWPNDITHSPNINILFIDIETQCEKGFPETSKADEIINLITIYSTKDKLFHTFGLGDFNNKFDNVDYFRCYNEEELLERFIRFIENNRHDIWSGWNSTGFDIPYIFNRTMRILDNIDLTEYNDLNKSILETKNKELQTKYRKFLTLLKKDMYWTKRLSLYNMVDKKSQMKKDIFTKQMKPIISYIIEGITDYDYMLLDQKFRMGKRDSYKLDNVAFDELNERKLEYEGPMKDFYKNDWQKFVEYNIQDVRLLVKLENKLGYLSQAISLSYKCHCQFKDNFGTVQKAETAIYNFLTKDNIIMEDRLNGMEESRIPGAYVTPREKLRRGMHRWIIDLDVASLYPSLMRGLNISYDTKISKVNCNGHILDLDDNEDVILDDKQFKAKQLKDYIKKKGYQVSSNNVIFENLNTKKGVLVKMLDMWYNQRKLEKKESFNYRQEALDIFNNSTEDVNGIEIEESGNIKKVSKKVFNSYSEKMRLSGIFYNLQWASKILLNSIYGCLASGYFRFHDSDLASAVTLSGQTIITHNGKMLNDYFNNEIFEHKIIKKYFEINKLTKKSDVLLYSDTDSIEYSSKIRTNNGIFQIGKLYDLFNKNPKMLSSYGHEIIDMNNEQLKCLTYIEKIKKVKFCKIKKLIRHKVHKKKWRIKVDNKVLILTEDHGCIVKRNTLLLRVKPNEIKKGDKIITVCI